VGVSNQNNFININNKNYVNTLHERELQMSTNNIQYVNYY
jgi:hypothetical protein